MAQGAKRGRVRRIGSLVGRLSGRAFSQRGFREASVLTEWRHIVGPTFAARCVPESLRRDGTLVVRADGATAVMLQHIEPQLRERIATYFGYRAVERFAYRQQPLPPPVPGPARRTPAAVPPAAAAAALAAVPDAGLRDALSGLGRMVAGTDGAP